MFTPQPYAGYVGTPRRTDNGAGGQVPSAGGSSFLFPQSATAPRTSPGFGPSTPTQGNTPFGMPTPGVPLPSGMQPGMQSAMQPRLPGAHSNSLLSPLSAAVPPQPLFSPQGRMLPAAAPPPLPPGARARAQADELPPLQSMLDLNTGAEGASAAPDGAAAAAASMPTGGAATHQQLGPTAQAAADGFWVTAFGYHTAAMVPQVLLELKPSNGESA